MTRETSRTWAEISLDALSHNLREIKRKAGPRTGVMAVAKADAYGHGAVRVAEHLASQGVSYFAVACLEEALALRTAGIEEPILLLGYTSEEYAEELLRHRLTQTVMDAAYAERLAAAAEAAGGRVRCHLKIDTGMARLGLSTADGISPCVEDALRICGLRALEMEGIFTHFAMSETADDPYTLRQIALFEEVCGALKRGGVEFPIRHVCNSGGVANYPQAYYDMVRPGLFLYGLYQNREQEKLLDLRPAMALKSTVAQVRHTVRPVSVSYGCTYRTEGNRTLCVLPVGYADGLFRCLSGEIAFLARNGTGRQCGRICMDFSVFDATGIPDLRQGDVVTLFGAEGGRRIRVEELAEKAGTIPYEIVCALSARVPRIYR